MRTFINLLIIFSAVISFTSCSHNKEKWAKYNDGVFSIWMPEKPKVFDQQDATAFGKQTVHYVVWKPETLELNKIKQFQVTYTNFPQRFSADTGILNFMLDSCINLRKKDYTDLDITSHPVSVGNYQGRAFILTTDKDNVTTIVKQFFAINKMFELTVVAKKDYPTNSEVDSFFSSFRALQPR